MSYFQLDVGGGSGQKNTRTHMNSQIKQHKNFEFVFFLSIWMQIQHHNTLGRAYSRGHGDQATWDIIAAAIKQNPSITDRKLSKQVLLTRGAVGKIRVKINNGQTSPLKTGLASPSYQKLKEMKHAGLKSVLKNIKQNATLKEIAYSYPVNKGKSYTSAYVCTLLKKYKLCRRTPLYFHPNKWCPANLKYYEDYTTWVRQQPLDVRSRFKFFDEVRVDHCDLFKTKVWGEERATVERSRMPTSEVYTINCLTLLDSTQPIIYNIISGASNAEKYVHFWLHVAYGALREGMLERVCMC